MSQDLVVHRRVLPVAQGTMLAALDSLSAKLARQELTATLWERAHQQVAQHALCTLILAFLEQLMYRDVRIAQLVHIPPQQALLQAHNAQHQQAAESGRIA